jgi:TonB-linked SusC/RagA family outer membrane protein
LGRVNYAYDNKYLLTASIRRDGSSRFGKNNKWGNFPSASIAWRIGQEDFMKGLEFLNDMKIRASYGIVGNNRIGDFSAIGRLTTSLYAPGNVAKITVNPNTMDNDFLSWEKQQQVNIGIDFSLFRNRINLEADVYRGKSIDQLMSVQLPTITGYGNQMQNVGQVENKGLEFSLVTRNFVREFKWTTNFNISFNRNKVLQLGPDERPFYQSSANAADAYITRIGDPIACFWGYKYEGVFMTQADLDKYPQLAIDKVGDGRYLDVNGDGKMDANDKTIIGNNHPNFVGGMNNSFSYKNFSLNIQMTFSQGAELLSLWRRMCGIYHGDRNGYTGQLNRWRSEAEPGDGWHFRPTRTPSGWQRDVSSAWVENGSFLRIRNASLSYNFDPSIANKLYLGGLRVFITGQNLYTWTKYNGFDPETSSEIGQQNARARGGDYAGYPTARAIIFGVNVSF